MNKKGADQTAQMCRLICGFVVHIWQKQVFFMTFNYLLCFSISLHVHYFSLHIFTGTIFSVTGTGTSKPQVHRVPSEYDVPPLPAPRGRNNGVGDTNK